MRAGAAAGVAVPLSGVRRASAPFRGPWLEGTICLARCPDDGLFHLGCVLRCDDAEDDQPDSAGGGSSRSSRCSVQYLEGPGTVAVVDPHRGDLAAAPPDEAAAWVRHIQASAADHVESDTDDSDDSDSASDVEGETVATTIAGSSAENPDPAAARLAERGRMVDDSYQFAPWEQYTRGIGSKLLARMGFKPVCGHGLARGPELMARVLISAAAFVRFRCRAGGRPRASRTGPSASGGSGSAQRAGSPGLPGRRPRAAGSTATGRWPAPPASACTGQGSGRRRHGQGQSSNGTRGRTLGLRLSKPPRRTRARGPQRRRYGGQHRHSGPVLHHRRGLTVGGAAASSTDGAGARPKGGPPVPARGAPQPQSRAGGAGAPHGGATASALPERAAAQPDAATASTRRFEEVFMNDP